MKFLTMTTMLLGDIIPSRAYLASTVITISSVGTPSSTRRIISTLLSSREILCSSSPLYNGFGGRDNAHNSMPLNDEIAMQKREAYAALSSFYERSLSLPDALSLSLMSSSWMWLIFCGLEDKYVIVIVVKACGVLVVHQQGNVVRGPDGPCRRHRHW